MHSLKRSADVCLLSMPFPPLNQPAMALGLLSAALREGGISTTALYPCIWFAEEVGLDLYVFVGDSKQEFLVGEWIFAGAAFPEFEPDHDEYLKSVLAAPVSQGLMRKSGFAGDPIGALKRARQEATAFIDRAARRVLENDPKIVGCTSTFMQHCASLAILRRIRELAPDVVTLLGGANCEGPMGVAAKRCFPWVDFVVSGEADFLIVDLCKAILEHERDIPASKRPYGVIGPEQASLADAAAPRVSVHDMDLTPIPDFDDYFASLRDSNLAEFVIPGLAMETSRGCWWGKVHHCTFCGLNGGNMDFRAKSAGRVIHELDYLATRHGIRNFNIVDNILDMGYIQSLLPHLALEGAPYRLFFETKANLRRDQVEAIANAGIRRLQPGIETMHDGVLHLIDKGTTALQNVRLLTWARELGVFITWNFLWDVPGEEESWYAEMAEWLPLIAHLQPPGVDRIQFHRFSPYHFRAESFGLALDPYPFYSYVYPLAPKDLAAIAYYFNDPRRRSTKEELARRPHLKNVMRVLGIWNKAWGQGGFGEMGDPPLLLIVNDDGERMEIVDSRPCAVAPRHVVEGLAARIYRAAMDTPPLTTLRKTFGDGAQAAIDDLVARKLLLVLGERAFALALRGLQPTPDSDEDFPGGYTDVRAWRENAAAAEAS
jgi:magnesium-protoporphyrin IX monomethyl ester (oxidative) cyclase